MGNCFGTLKKLKEEYEKKLLLCTPITMQQLCQVNSHSELLFTGYALFWCAR